MKVTLRKAAQLSTEVYKLISLKAAEVQSATAVKVKPVRSNKIEMILVDAVDELSTKWNELRNLYAAYLDLRVQIGNGNSEEVTSLLSHIAVLDMEIKAQTQLLNSINVNPDSDEVIEDDFERACLMYGSVPSPTESYYGRSTDQEYRLNVVDAKFKSDVELTLLSLKRMKNYFNDRLMEVNIMTEIELDEFTEEILKKFRII